MHAKPEKLLYPGSFVPVDFCTDIQPGSLCFKSSMAIFLKMLQFEGKIQACFLLTSSMAIWSMMYN